MGGATDSSLNNNEREPMDNTGTNSNIDAVQINGETYVKQNKNTQSTGKRAVVVVDRGWIFAGDVTEANGRILLDRAVWVFKWQSIGFAAVIENPQRCEVDLRPMTAQVDVPAGAEIFRIPVADDWGLK